MAERRKGSKSRDEATSDDVAVAAARPAIVDTVRGLAAIVADHALTELIVDLPDATITLRRGGSVVTTTAMPMGLPMQAGAMPMGLPMQAHQPVGLPAASASTSSAPVASAAADNAHAVTSPFVGTFYRRPNPDSPNYVSLNDRVDKGQVLCIVEAMKLMNEIEADIAGTIVGVLAEDGAPVEYGQALFKIKPA
jgi:acetyl-CoA carboxylase biotin carboxyl carrier protein